MKQYISFISILTLLALFSACEPVTLTEPETDGLRTVTIGTTYEGPATKAEIGDDLSFSWTPGDLIDVWTGSHYVTSAPYVSDNTFTLLLDGLRSGFAVYPASVADPDNATAESLRVTLPESYDLSGKDITYSPMPMIAINNEGADLNFYHVGGLLRMTLRDIPAEAAKIQVSLPGHRITGSFAVTNPGHPGERDCAIATDNDATAGNTYVDFTNFTLSGGATVLNLPVPTGTYNTVRIEAQNAAGATLANFGVTANINWDCERAWGKKLTNSVYVLEVDKTQLTYGQDGIAGNGQQFTVTSSRTEGAVQNPAPWKTQIKVDGTWVDLADACPDWLSSFPRNSEGITTLSQRFGINIGDQPVMSHEARLKAGKVYTESGAAYDNSEKANALDLSKYNFITRRQETLRTSANTYVVSAPGWYKIPLVYGNNYENGYVVDDACKGKMWALGHLDYFKKSSDANIWLGINYPWMQESFRAHSRIHWEKYTHWNGTEAVTEGRQWSSGSDVGVITGVEINQSEEYLYFHVDEDMIRPGNVLLATYEDNDGSYGDLTWSWHIWITDQDMTLKPLGTNQVLPVNLGWIDDTEGQYYPERSAVLKFVSTESPNVESFEMEITQPAFERISTSGWQTYYQWGRKDPLSEGVINVYDDDGALNKSIKHPTNIMYDTSTSGGDKYYDWTSANYNNLWDSQNMKWKTPTDALPDHKTVYDPSPRGFSVSPDAAWDAFASYGYKVLADKGIIFYTNSGKSDSLFFPASGYIFYEDALLKNEKMDGCYWTTRPGDNVQKRASYSLRFRQSGNSASIVYKNYAATSPFTTEAYRAYAYSVRPVLYNVSAQASDVIEGSQMQEIIFADHATEWGWTTDTNLKSGVTKVVDDITLYVAGENTFSANDPKYIVADQAITLNNKNVLRVSVPAGKQVIQINLYFANGDGRAEITATSSPNTGGGFTDGSATKDAIWRIDSYSGGVFTPIANVVTFRTSTTGSGRKIYGLSVIYK